MLGAAAAVNKAKIICVGAKRQKWAKLRWFEKANTEIQQKSGEIVIRAANAEMMISAEAI